MKLYIYSGGHRNGPCEIVSFFNFSEITSLKMTKSVGVTAPKKCYKLYEKSSFFETPLWQNSFSLMKLGITSENVDIHRIYATSEMYVSVGF